MSFKTVCTKCKRSLTASEFYPSHKSRKLNKLQSWCKTCSRVSSNAFVKKKSQEIRDRIGEIKVSRGCIDCGYNKSPEALDFDHLKDKSFGIGGSSNKRWEDLLQEIDKCEVVCANCHRIRTKERLNVVRQSASEDS